MNFAAAHGDEETELLEQRGDRRSKRPCVLSYDKTGRAEDVVEAETVGGLGNLGAVLPRALERLVLHAHEREVVVAQRGKPGDFDGVAAERANCSRRFEGARHVAREGTARARFAQYLAGE